MNLPSTLLLAAVGFAAACGRAPGSPGATTAPAATTEQLAGELAVARAGCTRCHAAPAAASARLLPLAGPALAEAARWHAADGGAAFLQRHHGGAAAADLAAWVRSLAAAAPPLAASAPTPGAAERGRRLFSERACGACHDPVVLDGLADRTDVAHVVAFLRDPAAHRPGVVHDFGLGAGEAADLAAWLLRAQAASGAAAAVPGFLFECFERQIDSAAEPPLTGLEPKARGVATALDVAPRTRDDHFVLRFTAALQVPADGEWTFVTDSDDCSWLWIDEQLVVRNEALAPHRRREGRLRLSAGVHALRVVYTEASGEQVLDVRWRGPGVAEQPIPATAASATTERAMVPPAALAAPDPAAVGRGRLAAAERRCAACHEVTDPGLAAVPAPAPAKPLAELGNGTCPQAPGALALLGAVLPALAAAHGPAEELQIMLQRDGCLACHARAGRGGLPPTVRAGLVEVEDLGDEGRLPPDLTAVGHRLRPAWLRRFLAAGEKLRPYVRVRMPKLPTELAAAYADHFATVDGRPGDDDEPTFSIEAAQRGRELVGAGGKSCITCHPFAGHRALGPQGLDLALQFERLRPAHFREWLLAPNRVRPNTRMPQLWVLGNEKDRADVDAVRAWLSLGSAAPLPTGLAAPQGLVLEPVDRVVLHGAFLKGLSARCVAVGSPLRTHYAYDVGHARLAWLWRGAFVDASGTWSGRAGQLLEPLGQDRVGLDDLELADAATTGAAAAAREVIGRRIDPAGYPIWRLRIGGAELEDHVVPRLAPGGSEVVRTLRVVAGTVRIAAGERSGTARVLGAPAAPVELHTGQTLELVYRW